MATLDRLYELYNVISDAKEDAGKHEKEFSEILTGVKGGAGERRLSSQFIAKFFKYFPNQQETALNALFDLCEDDDVSIRKQAIKDLPSLCRGRLELVPKVSDILAQLLQMEDPGELSAVQSSLVALLKTDSKGTLTGLFYQIQNSEDELVRERCARFLHGKVKTLGSDIFTPEIETLIVTESKKIIQSETTEEEFVLMMGILRELKSLQNSKGYLQMVELVAEQINLEKPLDITELENVHRFVSCMKTALPYFSPNVRSTLFLEYMWREIVPSIPAIEVAAGKDHPNVVLDLLKILAELVVNMGALDDVSAKVTLIYQRLLEVMPVPPEGDAATEALEGGVSLEFSRCECLLFTFHKLAKQVPEFLTEDEGKLKDFRTRLQYFARVCQAYQKRLREAIANKKGEELKTEENKIKLIALTTTANINSLIKDLFHQPPSYKALITLSWKPVKSLHVRSSSGAVNGAQKRHAPITFDGSNPNPKHAKGDRQIYAPPRDKYSARAGQYFGGSRGSRSRGRGFGSRGGFRSRGGYRGSGRGRF
ncbi:unnamed protein product [Meganyctiphanes norvegica]|uniref:Apoptosis inhibitor 5 n=1 Tax=Meganyctiphanes norvegica TaxID=48144 RepID=A0AAV2R1J5_MEGNR